MSVFDENNTTNSSAPTSFDISAIPAGREGFDWPVDRWFIERILFMFSGSLITFSIFLYIVTGSGFFLLITMTLGVLQGIFALTGFSILVKALLALGIRQK